MRIGAHVPTRGSLASAVDAAVDCRAECIQLFVSNPRAWASRTYTDEQVERFRERRAEAGIGPVFVHAAYLVNVASSNPAFLAKSIDSARADLEVAERIGAEGLVVHAGAGGPTERPRAVERAAVALLAIAAEAERTEVLVELTAGGAGTVASTLPEARELFDALAGHPRIALCMDTCHLFAAGYALDTEEGAARWSRELGRLGLQPKLRLVHANDAKHPRGSRRDAHEHIGKGHIGEEGLRAVLAQPSVRKAAVVIETYGSLRDHRENVERLRSLAP